MTALKRIGWRALAVGLVAIVFAILAARDALAFAMQGASPEIALRMDPGNPVALTRSAEVRLAAGDEAMDSAQVDRIARASIRRLPLNAEAFRLFGLAASADADLELLSERMALAGQLSRRDLSTQLFLIEDAVRRNNIADALESYDTALRSEESSRNVLYPVLTEAMREPLIRRKFLPYIRSTPPWLESFLRYAVSNSTTPAAMADLALEAGGFPQGDEFSSLHTELLSVLAENGEYLKAIRYYRSLKDADQKSLLDLAMSDGSTNGAYAPISWQPYAVEGIDAVWVSEGRNRVSLDVSLDAGFSGPIARKVLALQPGTYVVNAPFESDSHEIDEALIWRISCQNGTKRLDTEADLSGKGSLRGQFTVPAGCPVQMVDISVRTRPGMGSIKLLLGSPGLERRN